MKVWTQSGKELFIIDSGYIGCEGVYNGSNDYMLVYHEYGYDEYYVLGTYDSKKSAMAVLRAMYRNEDYDMPKYAKLKNGEWL